jgi:hypothetical protein
MALRGAAQPAGLPQQAEARAASGQPASSPVDTFTSQAGGAGAIPFTQLASDNTRGLNDASSTSLDLNGRLALRAYRDRQSGLPEVQATGAPGTPAAQGAQAQAAAQQAQASALVNPLNLLG